MGLMAFRRNRAAKLKKAGKNLEAYGLEDQPSESKPLPPKATKKVSKKASNEEE